MCCTRLPENTGRKKVVKNRHLGTIAPFCRAVSSQLRHRQSKKLLSNNVSSRCPHNMVNFGPLAAEIGSGVWGSLRISTGFASWQRYCTVLQQWASANLCGVEQRTPPIFGRATITLGIGPHFSCYLFQFIFFTYIFTDHLVVKVDQSVRRVCLCVSLCPDNNF